MYFWTSSSMMMCLTLRRAQKYFTQNFGARFVTTFERIPRQERRWREGGGVEPKRIFTCGLSLSRK